ncbi:MAG: hypothetical protein COB04_01305 [Gammaproteobacteria bacterium]|nr:MAG: hypothetical protein COB04_01305 [Gammaproteobacteria bacterium]
MLKIAMQPSRKRKGGAGSFLNHLDRIYSETQVANVVGSKNPFQDIGLFNSVASGLPFKPYVLRMDGIYFDQFETMGSNRKLNKKIYHSIRNAQGIIFQSRFSKQLIVDHYGFIECPSTIISNGSPIALKSRLNQSASKDVVKIVCSAVWRRHKRLKETIAVVKQLYQHYPCELVVLGDVEEAVEECDFVTFMGDVNREVLFSHLQDADIFLHLCWLDNCPNSVVEALAHRVPVVCSNLGGTQELIESTGGGRVANCDELVDCSKLVDLYNPPPLNVDAVVREIAFVLENSQVLKSEMDVTPIDINEVSKRYLNFLVEILNIENRSLQTAC